MKNSTLIFRIIALISGILIVWKAPLFMLLVVFIAILFVIFAYFLFCVLELFAHSSDYGNEYYGYTIVPKKYNVISIFIDWMDSFPSIIKKKDLEK
jgi:hypothetical protein